MLLLIAINIDEQSYIYDANGNKTGFTHDESGQRRNMVWDEENRIRSIMGNGTADHYSYAASGESVLRGHSSGQNIYANPYLVLKSSSSTRYSYIEDQRIIPRLGSCIYNYNKFRKKVWVNILCWMVFKSLKF